MPIELHCHTHFSVDGHQTPETLVDIAAERGIETLAITEHNSIGSLQRAKARAAERGIRYLAGVELDATFNGETYHFLAFEFDPSNRDLQQLIEANYAVYPASFEPLLKLLLERGILTREEVQAETLVRYQTHPSPRPNMWVARDLFVKKKLYPDNPAAMKACSLLKLEADEKFPSREEALMGTYERTRDVVHAAGGVLLLAHVARYHSGDVPAQRKLINALIDNGLDGFELFHPKNMAEPAFQDLVAERERLGCATSGGSDCHDSAMPTGSVRSLGASSVPEYAIETIDAALRKWR